MRKVKAKKIYDMDVYVIASGGQRAAFSNATFYRPDSKGFVLIYHYKTGNNAGVFLNPQFVMCQRQTKETVEWGKWWMNKGVN